MTLPNLTWAFVIVLVSYGGTLYTVVLAIVGRQGTYDWKFVTACFFWEAAKFLAALVAIDTLDFVVF